jgi:serine phosphatase RsbU (regulator of sigma subunit)/PAS domain-containing protein
VAVPASAGLETAARGDYDARDANGSRVTAIPEQARLGGAALDTVLEAVPVGVLVLDAELRVVRANAALCEIAGGQESGHLGRPVTEVLPWLPETTLRQALDTGEGFDVDLDSGPAGLARRFTVALRPISSAAAPALACLIRDVTELASWRRGLGGIEDLAVELAGAATQSQVTDVIVARSRELVGAATVAAALLAPGGRELELVGAAGFSDGTDERWRRFDVQLRTPVGVAVRTGRPVFADAPGDHSAEFPDLPGMVADVTAAAVPVRGRAGVIGALSFRFAARGRLEPALRSAMVTIGEQYGQALERARLFEAAEAERQRLSVLMNQLPVGVAIAEAPSGDIVAVNPKATEIWRVPEPGDERITDVSGYVAFHPDGRRFDPADWPVARSLATGEIVEGEEIDVEFGDGTRGFVNISARPIYDAAGRMLGAVTTLVDVTEARRRETEARFIADATDLLTESLDPEESLRRLARLVVPRLADWCAVYVGDGGGIRTVALEHSDPAKVELGLELNQRYPIDPDGTGGVAEVMRSGRSQLTREITREMVSDDDLGRIVFDELGLRSALTVPLRARGRLFGALTLVSAESDRLFDERDLRFAEDFATHAALAVANARLYAEQEEIARTLQRSLLPLRLPDIPGLEMTARYRAAGAHNMVGGDFYDLWAIGDDGRFGIAIGDVCGKGAAAAALTALARHTVRTASIWIADHRPADVLRALNDAVIKRAGNGQFCTVAHAFATPIDGGFMVTLASGGHPLPFIIRADGTVEQPGRTGTLLGILPEVRVHEHRTVLRPGDQLVMWTDGISDRRGDGELFGEERLRELLVANARLELDDLADTIEAAVVGFSRTDPQDDIAIVVARIRPF